MAIRPAMVMTMEMTKASRGRRMKTEERTIGSPCGWRGGPPRRELRADSHARPQPLLALHDHPIAFLQAVVDGIEAVALGADLDAPLLGLVVRPTMKR